MRCRARYRGWPAPASQAFADAAFNLRSRIKLEYVVCCLNTHIYVYYSGTCCLCDPLLLLIVTQTPVIIGGL